MSEEEVKIEDQVEATEPTVSEEAVEATEPESTPTSTETPTAEPYAPSVEEVKEMPESMAVLIPTEIKKAYAKRNREILNWEVIDINGHAHVKTELSDATTEVIPLAEWK
jgi:hypothetical protein